MKKTKKNVVVASICTVALAATLGACSTNQPAQTQETTPAQEEQPADTTKADNKATDTTKADEKAAEDTAAPETEAGEPTPDEFGVITAAMWKDTYPEQYETYMENQANSPEGKIDYLEEYPELKSMYEGYGFAKGYDEAASHNYTLDSIKATPRVNEKTLANCITCKTPQFTAMVNAEGEETYTKPFADLIDQFNEPISCYNCHENDPETVTVTQQHFQRALGEDADKAPAASEACGQCHNEYYFAPDTKYTTNPYEGLEGMGAEEILAYYDELGFSDWEHPTTGAAMLKAQHPEFETIYGASPSNMANMGYSCADCHMETTTDANGNEVSSHLLINPTESETIMAKCQPCHEDLAGQIADWQTQVTDREHELAGRIAEYIELLGSKKDSLDAETLAEAQNIHRQAQFYWDFVMVENSEGAHNPTLALENLDKCEALLDQGFELLK